MNQILSKLVNSFFNSTVCALRIIKVIEMYHTHLCIFARWTFCTSFYDNLTPILLKAWEWDNDSNHLLTCHRLNVTDRAMTLCNVKNVISVSKWQFGIIIMLSVISGVNFSRRLLWFHPHFDSLVSGVNDCYINLSPLDKIVRKLWMITLNATLSMKIAFFWWFLR